MSNVPGDTKVLRDGVATPSADGHGRMSDKHARTLDAVPATVFRLDRNLRYVYVNQQFAQTTGIPSEKIIGTTIADAGFGRELTESFENYARKLFETGDPVEHDFEHDDRCFYARLSLDPSDGTIVGVVTDVTLLKKTQATLRDTEVLFHTFMDHLPASAWVKDQDGRYVFVNSTASKALGIPPEQWLGKTDSDICPAELAETYLRNDRLVLETNECLRVREMGTTAGGPPAPVFSIKFPINDSNGRRYVGGVAVDLAEREQLEEERRKQAQLLQTQKLESLGMLAGGIAHDFNNLLTAMLGYASLARMQFGENPTLDGHLSQIEKAAERAAELCQQMLAYAGRGQVAARPTDLNRLVAEMGQLLTTAISKKVVLRYQLAEKLPTVLCDPTQIRQVVMNLITNASDAIGDRSGLITLTTGMVGADRKYLDEMNAMDLPEGWYIYLEVSDTGTGMSDDIRRKIFDPFFTTKFTGRGLGLAAVQGILRGHRGAVKVYSQPGRGSTFKVILPAPTSEPETPAPLAEDLAPFGRGRAVLVIDDEEDVRVLARKVLELADFHVVLAVDGRAGVEVFCADPDRFAAALVDLTMPHLSGVEVFREMRLCRPDVRVILTSGFAEEDATSGLEGKGLAGFVRKPFRPTDLLTAILTAIGP